MSVQAMSWVIEHSPHKGGELLCLMMIANYAHADGTGAYPSASRLAKDCRMSARQIVRMVHRLEESGALKIDHGAGPRGVNVLTVVMDESAPKITDAMDVTSDKLSYPKTPKPRSRRVKKTDNLSEDLPSKGDMSTDKMSDVSLSGDDKSSPRPMTNPTLTPDIAMSPKPLLNRQLEPSEENVSHETRGATPFDLCMVLCEVNNVPWEQLSPSTRSKQLGIAKQFSTDGYTADRLRRLLLYVKSGSWRTSAIDLATARGAAPAWETDGEPDCERIPTRASPKRGGARNGEKNGNDWAREIAEEESRERARSQETDRRHRGDLAELPAW